MNKILCRAAGLAILLIIILSVTQYLTKSNIQLAEQSYYNQQLASLLQNINYNNNLLQSTIQISDKQYLDYLGKKQPTQITLAKFNNILNAVILNVTAPNGYNGNIDLLVAVKVDIAAKQHSVLQIKTIHHQETPGLGDFIDNDSWLQQFKSAFLNQFWGLKKDNKNNQFDSVTGATITSRAVTEAVQKSLLLLENHPEILAHE